MLKCVKLCSMDKSNGNDIQDKSLDWDNQHEMDLCVINNSYSTYIPHVNSQKIDCSHHPSHNCGSHFHIITLIEHVLNNNDAILFCMNMKQLKQTCSCIWMIAS